MRLATADLDPTLDPFAVAGDTLLRNFASDLHGQIDARRLLYDVQKLKLRAGRVGEGVERLVGARAGPRPTIEVSGIDRLEAAVRYGAARLGIAIIAGACLLGASIVSSNAIDSPQTAILLAMGAVFSSLLLVDLVRRGRPFPGPHRGTSTPGSREKYPTVGRGPTPKREGAGRRGSVGALGRGS